MELLDGDGNKVAFDQRFIPCVLMSSQSRRNGHGPELIFLYSGNFGDCGRSLKSVRALGRPDQNLNHKVQFAIIAAEITPKESTSCRTVLSIHRDRSILFDFHFSGRSEYESERR
jgi:hypothetical protein